jgi:hypothetical protein
MEDYLESVVKQFQYYKLLGEKALNQVPESEFFYAPNEESNSLAVIVKHLSGNMLRGGQTFLPPMVKKKPETEMMNLKMKRLQKKNCFKSGMLAGMFF